MNRTSKYVVEIEGDNFEQRDQLRLVMQEFSERIGANIIASNPHNSSRAPYSGKKFGLCIFFWTVPESQRNLFERGQVSCAYGYSTLDGQNDGFILKKDSEFSDSKVVDSGGNVLAVIVENTLYVLFDLPHDDDEHNNADKILRLILDDYFLFLTDKAQFEKLMTERSSKRFESKFSRMCKAALRDHVESDPEEIKVECLKKKAELLAAIRDRKMQLNSKNSAPTVIDDAGIDDIYQRLCKLSVSGRIRVVGDEIFVPVGQIDIKYDDTTFDIGEFEVVIDPVNYGVRCVNTTRTIYSNYHPHVDSDGICCLGDASYGINLLLKSMELEVVVLMMIEFLKSYCDENPYDDIESWPEKGA